MLKASPLVYPERDTHLVTASFISDIHSRMQSICGEKITFSTQAFHATSDLNPASSSTVNAASGHANLSLTPLSAAGHSQHRPLGNNRGSIGLTPSRKENQEQNKVAVEPSVGDGAAVPLAKRFCHDSTSSSSGPVRQTVPGLNQPVRNLFQSNSYGGAATPIAAGEGVGSAGIGDCRKSGSAAPHPKTSISKSLLSLVPTSVPITQVPENVIKQVCCCEILRN